MKTGKLSLVLAVACLVAASVSGCLKLTAISPRALFTASLAEQVVPFTASFDGTLSYAGREIVSYLWNFGDGGAADGPVVDHQFVEDGVYDVTLTVIDEAGLSASTTMELHALNPPPTAGFTYSPKSNMDGVYFVSCSETITFDAAELCDDDGSIVSYDWYFGYRTTDGEPATASGPTVTHEFLYAGTYTVVLTVTDNDGGTTIYSEEIVVEGGPPCNADVSGDGTYFGGGTCQ
jgi:PKD repeat protein